MIKLDFRNSGDSKRLWEGGGREGQGEGDRRTMLLSTLVLLHGEHYIKNHVNKHVKKMEIYDSCLSYLKRSSMEDR